jgi:hypothetical protein
MKKSITMSNKALGLEVSLIRNRSYQGFLSYPRPPLPFFDEDLLDEEDTALFFLSSYSPICE